MNDYFKVQLTLSTDVADVNQRLTPPAKRSATNNRVPPGFATGGADGEPHKPNKPIVVLSQPKSTIKPMQLNTDRVIAKAATTPFDMGINGEIGILVSTPSVCIHPIFQHFSRIRIAAVSFQPANWVI